MKLGTLSLTIAITVLTAAGTSAAAENKHSSILGEIIYAIGDTIAEQAYYDDQYYGAGSSLYVSGSI